MISGRKGEEWQGRRRSRGDGPGAGEEPRPKRAKPAKRIWAKPHAEPPFGRWKVSPASPTRHTPDAQNGNRVRHPRPAPAGQRTRAAPRSVTTPPPADTRPAEICDATGLRPPRSLQQRTRTTRSELKELQGHRKPRTTEHQRRQRSPRLWSLHHHWPRAGSRIFSSLRMCST
jgi:hypothetical protein